MKKKLIAALTSAAMVATMVPATAFAAADSGTPKSEAPTAVVAAENESEAVTAFKEAVKKIPAEGAEGYGYTDAYKAALDAAASAYNALNASERDTVKADYAKYNSAQKEYDEWKKEVGDVIAMIDALPDKIGLTAADGVAAYTDVYKVGSDLTEAIGAYKDLEDITGQQDSVTNKDKLYAVGGNDQGGMVNDVNYCAVNKAIKKVAALQDITGNNYTTELNGAKTAVDNLTTAQRAVLAQDVMSKYQKAESTVNKATKLMQAYDDAYEALTKKYANANTVTAENVADADALYKVVEDAFAALSEIDGLAGKADYYNNVEAIGKKIAKLQDAETANKEAQPVLDRIAALPKASDVKDMSLYDEVNAIYEAYSNLTPKAQKVVNVSTRAAEFNNVVTNMVRAYNAMTAEEQAARAKAALDQLPSDDYEINQRAQTEYMMATTSAETQARINAKNVAYNGNAKPAEKYFTQNEIDKAEAIGDDLKAAYQAEVEAIKELIKDLKAEAIEAMDATEFAAAKSTIDQAEAAVDSLSPEATKVYDESDNETKTKVEALINARDAYLKNSAEKALKARMDQLPAAENITAENLATYKPVVEALRADYDAYVEDLKNKVYGEANTENVFVGANKTSLDYLTAAEAKIAALELGQDAAKVDEAIEALPILDADKTYTAEELLAAQAAIATVREAYDNLSADEAGEVTKYAKLVEAEKAVVAASQKTIDTEAEKIGEVGLTLTEAQIQQYKVVYDLLSALGKDTSAITGPGQGYYKAAIAKLNVMYPNAAKVSDQLSKANLKPNASAADILAAREAYDALSDIEKTLVDPESVANLLDVEKNGENSDKLLSKATVAAIADQEYTGDQIRPTLTVTSADKKTLKEGTDYTVTYNNNVLVGTATVTITGTGDYAGTITTAFDIVGISINDATVTVANQQTYTGSALTPAVTVKVDGKELTTADYDVAYSNNTNVGTATVTITGKGNYAGTATAKFEIVKANIQNASVTGVANRYYTGKARTQTDLRVYIAGKVLSTDNYSVVYTNNKNIGQASLTITGKGNYTGTITKTFIVKPRKVSNVKVTKGKKRVTVRYKKQNGARYQIYYKKAGTKAKTVKTAAVKRTIKKLKSGKTYTIKVRAYKKIGSKTYYGKYSKAKKVRVR